MYLSRRGFFLPKTSKLCEAIRTKLLVKPNINAAFDFSDQGPISFHVFQETDAHLVLPRFFATTEFKKEKYDNQIKISNTREFLFKGSLRDYQQKIIDEIKDTIILKKNIINILLADKIKKKYNMTYAYFEAYLI